MKQLPAMRAARTSSKRHSIKRAGPRQFDRANRWLGPTANISSDIFAVGPNHLFARSNCLGPALFIECLFELVLAARIAGSCFISSYPLFQVRSNLVTGIFGARS